MRGRIIGFDPMTYKGAINGEDGHRYDFVMQDWRGSAKPKVGLEVDFQPDGAHAREIYPLTQTANTGRNPKSLLSVWFSFQGRICRKDYWLKGVLLGSVLGGLAGGIMGSIGTSLDMSAGNASVSPDYYLGPVTTLIVLPLYFVAAWAGLAIQVKRWHDRDKSGWWWLISLIPIVGWIYSFVETGCLRGTVGDNKYGPDPLTT